MNPLTASVYTVSAESKDPIYDDNSNPVDDNGSSFDKCHVLTTDDQESAGAFKSGLRTVLIRDRSPVTADSSEAAGSAADEHDHKTSGTRESDHRDDSEDDGVSSIPYGLDATTNFADEDDDPPASLLNLAPLWCPQPDWSWPELLPTATETTSDDSPVAEHATADPSQVSEETSADKPSGDADATTDASADTAGSVTAVPDTVQNLSQVATVATADSPSTAPDTTTGVASVPTPATANPTSAVTITTARLPPAAAVVPATLTPVFAVTALNRTQALAINAATRTQVATESPAKPTLGAWHKWVVTLFAGRKPVPRKNNEVNNLSPPVSIISWTRNDRDSDAALPLPSQPHLELTYLIPATFDKRMRLQYHSNIHPAPNHDCVGKVAIHGDASPTNNVQRGFVIANRPASAPSPPRRDNDHYSSLLARDDTTWAEWNKLNITADSMPFTRSQSDTQLLHPQTGVKMPRANGHLTKSQTGHAFLEDAGHRYPFGQGPGW
ncbi:hypothetical protein BKA58DRAFT_403736 [Alternaria rosae]|uniref:uncharacterized protein n=1 Tax=Alternaria rosae TaxID=1187941 RepID=UPI001E8E4B80|nr:uncharacterized protein BKA58DRAFT_403736 [Alternaria rosae]KAH6866908.1 hypothetical protein BKA58DRAFT_403736 [Alternaria rosae]